MKKYMFCRRWQIAISFLRGLPYSTLSNNLLDISEINNLLDR